MQKTNNMAEQKLVRFDWAMKNLLRNKANYDIVEGFLCALLEDNDIQVIEILESEGNKKYENDKFNRVDVLVKDSKGRSIIIEIQNTRESDYLYRMVYGTAKNISESIDSGDKYRKINKVISVSILYFDLGIGDDYLYYGQTEFVGLTTNERINKDSEKIKNLIPKKAIYNQLEIFPEYYLIQVEKYKNIVSKAIDEWVYWFKNERVKEGSDSKNIEQVSKKLNILKMLPEARKTYERFLERLASEKDMVETAEQDGYQKAEEELRPLIKAERKKVEAERKKVEAERKKVEQKNKQLEQKNKQLEQEQTKIITTVCNLKKMKLTNQKISEITNLSIEIIEKI